jgi:hypothetical protein
MSSSSVRSQFWQWFKTNGPRLRAIMYGQDVDARQEASEKLRRATEKVEPGVVLEFGHADEGAPMPVIVSADSKPERVDVVKEFVASAPALPGWEIVAFRPRMEIGDSIEIALENEHVSAADIWFRVQEDDDGLDLTLHVRGLTRQNEQLRGLGATLLAEHAVGEQDALTLLSALHLKPLPKAPAAAGLRPFRDLPGLFDETKEAKYPPPGQLAIDPETDWSNMKGTMGGWDAMILFHTGLRPAAGHPRYDRRLTVSIPFHETNEAGMPDTEEEYLAVCDFGDKIAEALREDQESLLAMTITTQGRRDLIFYTSDADAALRRLEAFQTDDQSHAVESAVQWDTFWGMYRSFFDVEESDEEEDE